MKRSEDAKLQVEVSSKIITKQFNCHTMLFKFKGIGLNIQQIRRLLSGVKPSPSDAFCPMLDFFKYKVMRVCQHTLIISWEGDPGRPHSLQVHIALLSLPFLRDSCTQRFVIPFVSF